jgi:hypothetical protein
MVSCFVNPKINNSFVLSRLVKPLAVKQRNRVYDF